MKEFADSIFEVDKNGTKFSKRVENTVEKGVIAHYEKFLIFPPVFSKDCRLVKQGLIWQGVNTLSNKKILDFVMVSASAVNKYMYVVQMMRFLNKRVKNMVMAKRRKC